MGRDLVAEGWVPPPRNEADFAHPSLPIGYRAAMSTGVAAHPVAVQLVVQFPGCFANVLIENLLQGRHKGKQMTQNYFSTLALFLSGFSLYSLCIGELAIGGEQLPACIFNCGKIKGFITAVSAAGHTSLRRRVLKSGPGVFHYQSAISQAAAI